MQTFTAISQGGELEFMDPKALRQFLVMNPGEMFVNVGKNRRKKFRSLAQNAYGYGVVLKRLTDYLSERTGYTQGQIKEIAKKELGFVDLKPTKNGKHLLEITRSSATFDPSEWEKYMAFLRQWGDEEGLYIPLPNEPEFDKNPLTF